MKKLCYYALLLLLFTSCNDGDELKMTMDSAETLNIEPEGMMMLGEKLNNPYSVSNMILAYKALMPQTRSDINCDEISATHRYVKFIPKTEEELSLLKTDSTLTLFQYPLDYEIIQYGSYRDPNIPDSQPTPLYCSVPIDKELPAGVEAEILENLFIPDESETETKAGVGFSESFVDALVEKSFELTGNIDDITPCTRAKKSKWVPQGSVCYFDTEKHVELPIEGLQIRCRRWFTTYTAYTNSDGSFKCKSSETFKNPANYSIVYERYDFEIRDAWLSTAKYDGPKTEGAWNVSIKSTDKTQIYYSTIFRAAYKYYFEDIHGLSRPPQNSFWKTQLKIKASKDVKSYYGFHNPKYRFAGVGCQVQLFVHDENIDDIFGETIHELSHAVHWRLYKSDYKDASEFVKESWARGVQHFLTKDVYPDYSVPYYSTVSYTAIVRDLIDGKGIRKFCSQYFDMNVGYANYYDTSKDYIDNVEGYSLQEIETSLNGVRNADGWKNNLIKLFDNETEEYLDDAFNFWSVK